MPELNIWVLDTSKNDFIERWSSIYNTLVDYGLYRDQIVFGYSFRHFDLGKIKFLDSQEPEENGFTYKGLEPIRPLETPKTVLVTGGAGFIGSYVAGTLIMLCEIRGAYLHLGSLSSPNPLSPDALLSRGDSVVIIDEVNDYYDPKLKEGNLELLRNKYGSDKFEFYRGDVCDEELVEKIFNSHSIDFVCHLAARAGVRPSIEDPLVYVHSNVRGTTTLLTASVKHGVKNFVYASSSSVYGGSKSVSFTEEEVVDSPVSPYAATKKSCEVRVWG